MLPRDDVYLEVHLVDGCNLKCAGCLHFSNYAHTGILSLEDADRQFETWSQKLAPGRVNLMGGEPTLSPYLLPIIRSACRHFSKSKIVLITNGLRLALHEGLAELCLSLNVAVRVSRHEGKGRLNYQGEFASVERLADRWMAQGIDIQIWDSVANWINKGPNDRLKFEQPVLGDADDNWNRCDNSKIRYIQLKDNHLWKCYFTAYAPLVATRFKLNLPLWQPLLEYKPLPSTATTEELIRFLDRQGEEVCSLCFYNNP